MVVFLWTLPLLPIDFGRICLFQFVLGSSLISAVNLPITSNYYREMGKYLSAHARSRSHFISHSEHSHFVLMNSIRFTSFELQLCTAVKSNYVDFYETLNQSSATVSNIFGCLSKILFSSAVVVVVACFRLCAVLGLLGKST